MNPGMIVKTQKGKLGRTYNSKGVINDKVPVYLIKSVTDHSHDELPILCRPETLKIIGFID